MSDGYRPRTVRRAESLDDLVNAILLLASRPFSVRDFDVAFLKVRKSEARGQRDRLAGLSESTLSDYFSVAKELGFIQKTNGLNEIPRAVSESLRQMTEAEIKHYVAKLLPHKLPVVGRFIEFLRARKPKDLSEIPKEEFNSQTARTIASWLSWSGILQRNLIDGSYYVLPLEGTDLSLEEFWRKLAKIYDSLRATQMVGVRAVYVKIPELREVFCTVYPRSRRSFDEFLRKALTDKRFRHKIEVTGAPIAYIEDERQNLELEPFEFEGRVFYFIALKP